MLYTRLLKLKEDTWNIIVMEASHWDLHLLEGIFHSLRRFCNGFFAKFGDSYTLLDVYNNFEKLELTHAHYEASTMRPPSRSRPQPPRAALTRSSYFFSWAKTMHLVAPILPSW